MLEMDPDAKPLAKKPRPVPHHLQKHIEDWLDQDVKTEIFEKVLDGEAITWCLPPKPMFTVVKNEELESHKIRPRIDIRIPNKSMKRSRCPITKSRRLHLLPA